MKKGTKENETVTADHVTMLLVIFIRMGYLNNASLYEAWSMVDDCAALGLLLSTLSRVFLCFKSTTVGSRS